VGWGWSGVEWSGVEWEWSGVEWSGVEWSGVEWSGVEWSGVGVEWSGVEWSGVERSGEEWEWSGVEWSGAMEWKIEGDGTNAGERGVQIQRRAEGGAVVDGRGPIQCRVDGGCRGRQREAQIQWRGPTQCRVDLSAVVEEEGLEMGPLGGGSVKDCSSEIEGAGEAGVFGVWWCGWKGFERGRGAGVQ